MLPNNNGKPQSFMSDVNKEDCHVLSTTDAKDFTDDSKFLSWSKTRCVVRLH
jgi:hypothetical protein